MIGSMLEHASLLLFDLPNLEIGFPGASFHLEQMKDPETLAALRELAESYFGRPAAIRVTPTNGTKGETPPSLLEERAARDSDRKKRLREDALAHPMVKAAQSIFEGKILEIKAKDKGFV